jgi:hypothetical protein
MWQGSPRYRNATESEMGAAGAEGKDVGKRRALPEWLRNAVGEKGGA